MNNRSSLVFEKKIKDLPKHVHSETKTSDMTHNKNCHDYLVELYLKWHSLKLNELLNPTTVGENCSEAFLDYLKNFFGKFTAKYTYNNEFPYGDLYNAFLLDIEKLSKNLYNERQRLLNLLADAKTNQLDKDRALDYLKKYHKLDEFIHLLYANENKSLIRAGQFVERIIDDLQEKGEKASDEKLKALVKKEQGDYERSINTWTPTSVNTPYSRLWTHLASDVKLQVTTSLPCVRTYEHQTSTSIKEYRFGTQVQVHKNNIRIYPTFDLWLQSLRITRILRGENSSPHKIDHIYFNNLSTGPSSNPIKKEGDWSKRLHDLENEHDNILVITLPANRSLFRSNLTESNQKIISVDDASELLLRLLTNGNLVEMQERFPSLSCLSDDANVVMSKKAKELLYGDADGDNSKEKEKIAELIKNSCEKLGFSSRKQLSAAELQALYFHLVKFELPKFILDKLKPKSFNMSCRDAIDRGGISSAYYNLILSLQNGTPLSKSEFYRALHAAPIVVKGRTINHHVTLLWNAVRHYINANPSAPEWLKEWCDLNVQSNTYFEALLLCENTINNLRQDQNCPPSRIRTVEKLYQIIKDFHEDQNIDSIQFTPEETRDLCSPEIKTLYAQLKNIQAILPSEVTRLDHLRLYCFYLQLNELEKYYQNAHLCSSEYGFVYDPIKKAAKKRAAGKLLGHFRSVVCVISPDKRAPNSIPKCSQIEINAVNEPGSRLNQHLEMLEDNAPRTLDEFIVVLSYRNQEEITSTTKKWTTLLKEELKDPLTNQPYEQARKVLEIIHEHDNDEEALRNKLFAYYKDECEDPTILGKLYNCFQAYVQLANLDPNSLPAIKTIEIATLYPLQKYHAFLTKGIKAIRDEIDGKSRGFTDNDNLRVTILDKLLKYLEKYKFMSHERLSYIHKIAQYVCVEKHSWALIASSTSKTSYETHLDGIQPCTYLVVNKDDGVEPGMDIEKFVDNKFANVLEEEEHHHIKPTILPPEVEAIKKVYIERIQLLRAWLANDKNKKPTDNGELRILRLGNILQYLKNESFSINTLDVIHSMIRSLCTHTISFDSDEPRCVSGFRKYLYDLKPTFYIDYTFESLRLLEDKKKVIQFINNEVSQPPEHGAKNTFKATLINRIHSIKNGLKKSSQAKDKNTIKRINKLEAISLYLAGVNDDENEKLNIIVKLVKGICYTTSWYRSGHRPISMSLYDTHMGDITLESQVEFQPKEIESIQNATHVEDLVSTKVANSTPGGTRYTPL